MATRLDRQWDDQEEIDEVLSMLIAHAGNMNATIKDLKARGRRAPGNATLKNWVQVSHWERYEELREKYAAKIEGKLANDMLDAVRRSTEGATLATEVAIERLKEGKDEDPARTAANLSTVSAKMTDKRLAMQGRPTQITETRGPEEMLRNLIARHPDIFGIAAEAPKQIEATADDA
jgi:hypothetical protein